MLFAMGAFTQGVQISTVDMMTQLEALGSSSNHNDGDEVAEARAGASEDYALDTYGVAHRDSILLLTAGLLA